MLDHNEVRRNQIPTDKLLKVGDKVLTEWHGHLTTHNVIAVNMNPDIHCQSGYMVKVAPSLRGSAGVYVDAGWFTKVEES